MWENYQFIMFDYCSFESGSWTGSCGPDDGSGPRGPELDDDPLVPLGYLYMSKVSVSDGYSTNSF